MKILILLSLILSMSAVHSAATSSINNISGAVLINGKHYVVATAGQDEDTVESITFDGKSYQVNSSSWSHFSSETVINGMLVKVTIYNLSRLTNKWKWLKNTVFNDAETICNKNSKYFFTISQTPERMGYAFFGNCLEL
jgi:hypothetical protein